MNVSNVSSFMQVMRSCCIPFGAFYQLLQFFFYFPTTDDIHLDGLIKVESEGLIQCEAAFFFFIVCNYFVRMYFKTM